ncbi:hypothetical protein Aab01nite_22490 [Paractinoplanes abujensis]|nr:hypothetical protein Aab01nite_22490 [Actinoplanes abujensis]
MAEWKQGRDSATARPMRNDRITPKGGAGPAESTVTGGSVWAGVCWWAGLGWGNGGAIRRAWIAQAGKDLECAVTPKSRGLQ